MVLAMQFSAALPDIIELVMLCDAREYPPKAFLLLAQEHSRTKDLLFRGGRREDSISWLDLEMHFPSTCHLAPTVRVGTKARSYSVSVLIRQQTTGPGSAWDIVLEITEQQKRPIAGRNPDSSRSVDHACTLETSKLFEEPNDKLGGIAS